MAINTRINILHYRSGSDKTPFMSKVARQSKEKHLGADLIIRFIGLTSQASNILSILRNVCQHILIIQNKFDQVTQIPNVSVCDYICFTMNVTKV